MRSMGQCRRLLVFGHSKQNCFWTACSKTSRGRERKLSTMRPEKSVLHLAEKRIPQTTPTEEETVHRTRRDLRAPQPVHPTPSQDRQNTPPSRPSRAAPPRPHPRVRRRGVRQGGQKTPGSEGAAGLPLPRPPLPPQRRDLPEPDRFGGAHARQNFSPSISASVEAGTSRR